MLEPADIRYPDIRISDIRISDILIYEYRISRISGYPMTIRISGYPDIRYPMIRYRISGYISDMDIRYPGYPISDIGYRISDIRYPYRISDIRISGYPGISGYRISGYPDIGYISDIGYRISVAEKTRTRWKKCGTRKRSVF